MNAPEIIPLDLSPVTATVDLPHSARQLVVANTTYLALAEAFGTIETQAEAEEANAMLKEVKADAKYIEEMLEGIVGPFKAGIARITALFRPQLNDRAAAEKVLKEKLVAFKALSDKRQAEERQKAEAERRRLANEATEKVAADRARAEEQARAERALAEEADRKRSAALAEGNAAAAAEAAAAAAAANERAQAVVADAEASAQTALFEAEVSAPVVPVQAKLAGSSFRDNWVAELADGFDADKAKAAIVAAIGLGDTQLLAFLDINESVLNQAAKSYKTNLKVPGYVAANRQVMASRRK